MIARQTILDHPLPVDIDFARRARGMSWLGRIVAGPVIRHGRHDSGQRRRIARPTDEYQIIPDITPDRHQSVLIAIEAGQMMTIRATENTAFA